MRPDYFDYVAVEDSVRRSGIISEDEWLEARKELIKHTFFTNRRKIMIGTFKEIIDKRGLYEVMDYISDRNNYIHFNF